MLGVRAQPEGCPTWAVTSPKGDVYEPEAAVRLVGYPRVSTRAQVKAGASIP